jgi:hypothetical protein
MQTKQKVTVLFCRTDTIYKTLGVDYWDADRDALKWEGGNSVIAHPPCRAWGILAHMAKPSPCEMWLAPWSAEQVRIWGGVLEHPSRSRLFNYLPPVSGDTDSFGGYTIEIDQYWFGHVAHKKTKLYICGVDKDDLPPIPYRDGKAKKSITGQVPNTKRCTQYEREYTPTQLATWLIKVSTMCNRNHLNNGEPNCTI